MPFRTGTPYPSMPVLVNVVRYLIPRVTLRSTLGCLTLAAPWRGLFYGKPAFYPDIEFCINILLKYFMGYLWKNVHNFVLDSFIGCNFTYILLTLVIITGSRELSAVAVADLRSNEDVFIYLRFSEFNPRAKDTLRKKSFSTSSRPIFFIRSSLV